MIRVLVKVLLVIMILFALELPAYGLTSSTELLEDGKKYTGKRIIFQGEAIGDVMKRGSYGWVNLRDEEIAVGVWAPVGMLEKIKYTGDYDHRGDTVEVEGVFSQNCKEHEGEIDIHAESLKIVEAGGKVAHSVDVKKVLVGGALSLLALTLFTVNRIQKRRTVGFVGRGLTK
ncbi:MAG: DNA-binding protein [Firmicutes bacterium]|nr:DNA-binding protein [Bacillota bacterium]